MRRVEGALEAYNLGQKALQLYLDKDSIAAYYRTIKELEVAVSLSYQAYILVGQMIDMKNKIYLPGSGDSLEHLNNLYNSSKHFDERILNGTKVDSPVPLWITNKGIEGIDAQLTFIEFADLIKKLTEVANILQDPASITRDEINSPH